MSAGFAVAGPGRGAMRPAPSSRRARSATAAATSPTVATSISASGHQRSPAYGRIAWPQPIGDSHDSVPSPTSPAARSRYAAPIAPPVIPYIDDVVWLTCAATAATPANTSPTPASEAPSASEPSAGGRRRSWRAR